MLALAIRFPSGRFHATPWGRHVNEGAPEWPPSPWRLLRALVATWKRKLDGDPACAAAVVEEALRKLTVPPSFRLPPATTGHTRHYMPWFKKGPGDKTMVFDAFVALDRSAEVVAVWPEVELTEEERTCLEGLAANLGFLGRAESWAEARLLTAEEAGAVQITCTPTNGAEAGRGLEAVRVLCADPASAFEHQYTPKHLRTEGRGKAKQTIETPLYDPDWHLCLETLELHDQRWSDPPGSKWITYLRPSGCFAIRRAARKRRSTRMHPTVVRFVLDSTVLPLVEDTLRVAETARIVAMGCFRRVEERRLYGGPTPDGLLRPRSEVFSGKDAEGGKLEGHGHTFYLPTDEDDDGRLDHLTLVATEGFGPAEVLALDRMRQLRRDEGDPVNLLLLALGQLEAVAARKVLGPSAIWVSETPFVVTRHQKTRGRKKDPPELLGLDNQRAFAQQVLLEELARLRERRPEIPEPLSVEPLNEEHQMSAHRLRPIQFKRFRLKRGDDGGRRAAGAFRIVFPREVGGPICLGHSSHFGLGLFVPAED